MRYISLILVILILSGCTVDIEGECTDDQDCVPASCCHASNCVSKENAPICKSTFCSAECQQGTLDCGQGSCICQDNLCIVSIK